jgi:hypothetical protein
MPSKNARCQAKPNEVHILMQQNDQRVNRGELDLAWELTCGELQKAVYTNSHRVLSQPLGYTGSRYMTDSIKICQSI